MTATARSSAASVSINPVPTPTATLMPTRSTLPPGETIPITATVTNSGSTRIYTVSVIRPDPFAPPVITNFTGSGTQLTGTFTWTGKSHRFVWWELHVLDASTNTYSVDDRSRRTTRVVPSPSAAIGAPPTSCVARPASIRTMDNPLVTCGEWSPFSSPVELEAPPDCRRASRVPQAGTTSRSAVSVPCGGYDHGHRYGKHMLHVHGLDGG